MANPLGIKGKRSQGRSNRPDRRPRPRITDPVRKEDQAIWRVQKLDQRLHNWAFTITNLKELDRLEALAPLAVREVKALHSLQLSGFREQLEQEAAEALKHVERKKAA